MTPIQSVWAKAATWLARARQSVVAPVVAHYVLLLLLPTVGAVWLTSYLIYDAQWVRIHGEASGAEAGRVASLKSAITVDLNHAVSDLVVLASHVEIDRFLNAESPASPESIAREFRLFLAAKGLYDGVRLLDERGMETVRVNWNGGQPASVPADQLQDKKDRYYFADTLALDRGEVFISPLDLNVEYGRIQQPLKPIIRLGTPVFDRSGRKCGIMVLAYLAEELLNRCATFRPTGCRGQVMLVNTEGYWLKGPQAEDEWGFMLGHNRSFAQRWPDAWATIANVAKGRRHTGEGCFYYDTVFPLADTHAATLDDPPAGGSVARRPDAHRRFWKIVSFMPHAAMKERLWPTLRMILTVGSLMVVLSGLLTFLLARTRIHNLRNEHKLAETNRRLEELATTDDLTGLVNRRRFMQALMLECSRAVRYRTDLSLAMIDVDFFKRYNDTYGHTFGDQVLMETARRLTARARETDFVARYAGDEFVVLMPNTSVYEAFSAAERLREAVAGEPISIGARTVRVTLSVGISELGSDPAASAEGLLAQADRALYTAKQSGRNRTARAAPAPPDLPHAVATVAPPEARPASR